MATVPFRSKKDGAPLEAFTVERCSECGAESKRPFRHGDVLFAALSECGCGGRMSIDRIFGEPAPRGGGRPAAPSPAPSAAAGGCGCGGRRRIWRGSGHGRAPLAGYERMLGLRDALAS